MAEPIPELVRARRADVAQQYRQRHREIINEKAKIRQRRRREEIRQASSAVQMEHRIRARIYRRTYRARLRQALTPAGKRRQLANLEDDCRGGRRSGRGRRGHNEVDVDIAASKVKFTDSIYHS
ncbi:hypothetical protein R3P38DRAFT_2782577 [Favolaschia claudopus]|uniref:Uncharacterized protein n=1 Tax=Favolaschia claudopus TaxID=2862362 RepID=A0AAW0B183_9AGAR